MTSKYYIIPYTEIIKSDSLRKYYDDDIFIFEIRIYNNLFLFVFYENKEISKVIALTKDAFIYFDDRNMSVIDYLNRFGYACIVN